MDAGPSVSDCQKASNEAGRAMFDARTTLAKAEADNDAATKALESADREYTTVAAWHQSIQDATKVGNIPACDIEEAGAAVVTIREQVQQGAVIREAIRQHREAERCDKEANEYDKTAESIRGAARGTDVVLSGLVASGRIRVEAGRLVVDHATRGPTLFAELSKGEKWIIAILEAVDRLREMNAVDQAIIIIPQEAWEGLDPANRAHVWREARRLEVSIVGAECDGGALRAAIYEPSAELQAVKDEPVKVAASSVPPKQVTKPKPAKVKEEATKTAVKTVDDEALDFS